MTKDEFLKRQKERSEKRIARLREANKTDSPNQRRLFEKMGVRIKVNKPDEKDKTGDNKD